ncbi:MupG family TIM beta-alpha barrel fold protein [Peribacillus sp. SCS-155]|uniref:MupG family TIM beta-alpha barrel fold protein n=1 Tax=Peribacillus sedimenti TaxID=3115297 RepID=UPI003905DCCA
MLGIPVFLGNQTEAMQDEYLKNMKEAGCQSIFTSLHIPEDDASGYKHFLEVLGRQALKHDMELMADVSPMSLNNLPKNDWVNVVGKIIDKDLSLLQFIGPGSEFRIIEVLKAIKAFFCYTRKQFICSIYTLFI